MFSKPYRVFSGTMIGLFGKSSLFENNVVETKKETVSLDPRPQVKYIHVLG